MSSRCPTGPKCFAWNKYGHIARDCTDKEAKKRNDEYMRDREEKPKPAETRRGRSEGTTASATH